MSPCHSWSRSCLVFICVLVCDNAPPPRVQVPKELAFVWAARRLAHLHSLLFLYSSKSQARIKYRLQVNVLVCFVDLFQDLCWSHRLCECLCLAVSRPPCYVGVWSSCFSLLRHWFFRLCVVDPTGHCLQCHHVILDQTWTLQPWVSPQTEPVCG